MNVLVVGKGGREHALLRALSTSTEVETLHALPGNAGMTTLAICHPGGTDGQNVLSVVKKHQIQLVIVGPENELVDGLADHLRNQGILVFGPEQRGAELEASKIFSKEFMSEFSIPTSKYVVVESVADVEQAVNNFDSPYVLKVDGLAAGKGVLIKESKEELLQAAREVFEEQKFGESGHRALLEEFQKGWELSFLILTNGKDYQPLPLSQDHKRLLEDDKGPNTGGMGVVGPLKINPELERRIHEEILKPTVAGLAQKGWDYRGILYVGVMVTSDGPKVIEYNVRFGDPEAQVVLPLLDGDWGAVMRTVSEGKMTPLKWKPLHSACVVLAAEGYPENPKRGVSIEGNVLEETPSSYFLHAGTSREDSSSDWKTAGGRVLNAIALGSTLQEAVDNCYAQAAKVQWPGCQMRKDIGKKVL